jgi:hypothetical protein
MHKMEEEEDVVVIANTNHLFDNDTMLSPSLLKLKIRNTGQYLNLRISVLRRNNFRRHLCPASIKDGKMSLKLKVHHAGSFNDL